MLWPLRIAAARLRPWNATSLSRLFVTLAIGGAFVWGDYVLFRRIFRALGEIEAATPFFALGLLRNLLALVFLMAVIILFSSAMTAAIGAFFTDLDLETYHVAPQAKGRLVLARWGKTFLQSATMAFVFIVPLFVAFGQRYHAPRSLYPILLIHLALLLTIPVTAGALVIVALVRFFPIGRVHQIVATIAILVLTVSVVAFRMSRPERLFAAVSTDDLRVVLQTVELPSIDRYPGTALADLMVAVAEHRQHPWWIPKIVVTSLVLFSLFFAVVSKIYFRAFVRARESLAPAAIGATSMTSTLDRLLRPFEPETRGLAGKEMRVLTRDVAQWSQLFLMAALLFLYLYNVRMLPLGGDARATIVAYANLGMAGFVVAAICLRFAFPSVSSEGKAFWIVQSAPISYRRFLLVKVLVYGAPLTLLSLLLTAFTNLLLDADVVVWTFTLLGAALLGVTLVSLGVALGAMNPNFAAENPLQVGLSLGGFGYMAVALAYVGGIMVLMARPVVHYLFWRVMGIENEPVATGLPIVIAITVSIVLSVVPLLIAEKRLTALGESR
ncbi:MAG: hypothetical protein ABIP63_02955 [Thermoanaerobaculia bacterium]